MVLFLFKVAVLNALVFNVEIKSGTYDFYTGWRRRKFNPSEHKYFILNDEVKKKTNTTAAKIVTNITPYMLVVLVTRLTHPEIIKKRNNDNDNISKKSRGETSG